MVWFVAVALATCSLPKAAPVHTQRGSLGDTGRGGYRATSDRRFALAIAGFAASSCLDSQRGAPDDQGWRDLAPPGGTLVSAHP
jgi:hypothetical protein